MADAERFGLPEEIVDQVRQWAEGGEDGVWPQNVEAVGAFLWIDTQWRAAPTGSGGFLYLGLDYASVRAGLEMAGISTTPALWADLLTMEGAALEALNGSGER